MTLHQELTDILTNKKENKMNHEFAVHKLNDEGMKKAKLIAESFDSLLKTLSIVCIEGRELAVCKTKLEEACFFAKKAMAISLGNQLAQMECANKSNEFSSFPPIRMNAPDEKY